MKYTVKTLANLAGITVRTLHHYDAIGLLKPAVHPSNGYRLYGDAEVKRLQQILFFRELEFSLEDIKRIMDSPSYDEKQALSEQKKLLELKKDRLEQLLAAIDTEIHSKGGVTMNDTTNVAVFNDALFKAYKEEAKQRWGQTDAWKQSQERTKHWTKKDYQRIAERNDAWAKSMATLFRSGAGIDSNEVQSMIEEHYEGLRTFYDPSYEMYRGLGQLYVDDARFTAFYDKYKKGLALFVRDAMVRYADNNEHKK